MHNCRTPQILNPISSTLFFIFTHPRNTCRYASWPQIVTRCTSKNLCGLHTTKIVEHSGRRCLAQKSTLKKPMALSKSRFRSKNSKALLRTAHSSFWKMARHGLYLCLQQIQMVSELKIPNMYGESTNMSFRPVEPTDMA
jgi:hypothetical protein